MTGALATIDLSRLRRVHLVGIGGMHMSAIARILLSRGVQISGSDLVLSAYTDRLAAAGAIIHLGHDAANLGDVDLVVTTVAAKDSNPELDAARRRGIPIAIRAEMVAALMQDRYAVCVAGTHGKTTTSSLIAFALVRAGRDPSYLLGGDAVDLGTNAAPGTGREIVVEADEYADAFLRYRPSLALITNVEIDHLDYFQTEDRVIAAFAGFLRRVRPEGLAIVCADSPRLVELSAHRERFQCRFETYALDAMADWTAIVSANSANSNDGYLQHFAVAHRGSEFGEFETPLSGRHMVANCLGAIAALHTLGLEALAIRAGIAAFHGARRRFQLTGDARGITIVDDYAHHPTEIAATLQAARQRYPGRRIVAVFQPHTYSRTQYLLDAFRCCFEQADLLLVLQTFAARETNEAGLDGRGLAEAVSTPRPGFAENQAEAVAWLLERAAPADVVITMGAGNVDAVGRALLEALGQ